MNIPAWQIVTWNPVVVAVTQWKSLKGFRCLGSSSRVDDNGRSLGSLLWASDDLPGRVGLAWDWCEASSNVFVMSDPMTVLSNVDLFDSDDVRTNEFKRVLHLNNAIYRLSWQKHIRLLPKPRVRVMETIEV